MQLDTPIPAKYTEVLGNIVDYYKIQLFDFEYEWPDDAGVTKERLQQAFIDRFYFREIGQETIQAFMHYMRTRWLELVPFYAGIFRAQAKSDPTDLNNDEYENDSMTVFNDAPKGVVEFDKNHATNYATGKGKSTGRRGRTKAEIARSVRDVAFNPLEDFLDDLDELFMGLF